ncbi:hypothetical protein [Thermaerobacter composti]|uniref:Beta-galactosidase n=1 Tax=Thermaerobacter composti TaxID=554949 RepID=A0ABZ0QPQ6_9FIRM|nr:hypothetical protein [Thermaerobacter composti]WPD19484.1 hypothetical protein Q5761_02105 [Thermaerobacter composti]
MEPTIHARRDAPGGPLPGARAERRGAVGQRVIELAGLWEVARPDTAARPQTLWVPRDPPSPPGTPPSPVVVYRRTVQVDPAWTGMAARLELDGALGRVRVRLNDREFPVPAAGQVPTAVDVTDAVRPGTNQLEIEVAGTESPVGWGAWARPEAVPPGYLPPGLTGPVRLRFFRGVVLTGLSWFLRPEDGTVAARPEAAATLPVVHGCARIRYWATEPVRGRCWLDLTPEGFAAPGVRVAWEVEAAPPGGAWEVWFSLPSPRLWTVWERGRPCLYRLRAWFEPALAPGSGEGSPGGGQAPWGLAAERAGVPPRAVAEDGRPWPELEALVGIRFVTRDPEAWFLNGEPLAFRGACVLPLAPWPGAVTPRRARAWVRRARALGLNALRVYAHAAHPALYEAASRLGIAVWQDLPLVEPVTREATATLASQLDGWVDAVGRWPAVIAWAVAQEPAVPPAALPGTPTGRSRRRVPPVRRPEWPWSAEGRRVGELAGRLRALDPGRPVLARVGVPSWTRSGGDARLFLPAGTPPDPVAIERRLRLVPHAAVVSSMGAPAFDQTRQATFVRYAMEILRRRPHPARGGFVYALNDAPGGPAFGLYTADGRPREAARAYRQACWPVRLVLGAWLRRGRPGAALRLPVWLVNDSGEAVAGRWTWQLVAGSQVLAAATRSCQAGPLERVPVGWVAARWPLEAVPRRAAGAEAAEGGGGEDPLILRLELDADRCRLRVDYPLPMALRSREPTHGPVRPKDGEAVRPSLGP